MRQRIMSDTINTDFVKSISLFAGLSNTEKEGLCKNASIYSYPKNSSVFRHGDDISYFYVVCSGAVRLFHETSGGSAVTDSFRTAGDTINTTAIFANDSVTHNGDAMTVKDTVIMDFPIEWLKKAVEKYPLISLNLLSSLSNKSYNAGVEANNQTGMSSQQHVACFLTRTCVTEELNKNEFKLPYSKSLIASRLRMAQETFSRTLPKLDEFGIQVEERRVKFYDLKKLEKNLCSHCPGAERCHARKVLQAPAGTQHKLQESEARH